MKPIISWTEIALLSFFVTGTHGVRVGLGGGGGIGKRENSNNVVPIIPMTQAFVDPNLVHRNGETNYPQNPNSNNNQRELRLGLATLVQTLGKGMAIASLHTPWNCLNRLPNSPEPILVDQGYAV